MNKKAFIQSLRSGLDRMGIADAEDVVRDYETHFDTELAQGKSEQEIAKELGDVRQILADFAPEKPIESAPGRGAALAGLILADLFVWMILAVLMLGIFIPIGLGVGGLGTGIYFFSQMDFISVFPAMPIPVSLCFGLTFLALGFWGFSATYFYARFLRLTLRKYSRWGQRVLGKANPPLPWKSPSAFWKTTFSVSGLAVAILFVLACVIAAASAGGLEFWHVWHWFE